MSGGGALEILSQIEALVSDQLQIVSYKWLSRNFSVSSNEAKRLLQEFVENHGNELEVLYTLSGWLKDSPQTYGVRLASRHNLSEAKQQFKDNCSVQVYSVQACIPKDLAVLWSTEFVQAEELFNQPTNAENCFRDNRFCGVSNSFVKRIVDGKPLIASAQSKITLGIDEQSKTKSMNKDPPFQPSRREQIKQSMGKNAAQSCSATPVCEKSDTIAQKATDQTCMPNAVKESASGVNKSTTQNQKPSSGNGQSLASMWGRASGKPKPLSAGKESNESPNTAHPAEALVMHVPASEDAASSDDDAQTMKFKRDSNGASRKRRVVMDFSDEDNEEEIVTSLQSPEPPNGQLVRDPLHNTENSGLEKKSMTLKEGKKETLGAKTNTQKSALEKKNLTLKEPKKETLGTQTNTKGKKSELSSEDDRETENKRTDPGITLRKRAQIPEGLAEQSKKDNTAVSTPASPKRRKVLKTRIDERGREVTEVVWEGEAAGTVSADNNTSTSDAGIRAPTTSKAASTIPASKAPTKPPTKAASKPAKGGGKTTPKQGNITSFFKKV